MIEPLTVVPPTKPKKKTASKSTSRKKKPVEKSESKVAMSMDDLYEKENPFKATKEDTTAQASKNTDDEDASKIASDVATPVRENGNPDSTLISDEPTSGRKLRLQDLNDAIESTKNMDVDNPGNVTRDDDSVESDPKETDLQDDVGTSLGQPHKPASDADDVADEKDSSYETAPEKDVNSGNSIEDSHAEESKGSEGDSEKDEEEEDTGDKENEKDVVDVDELIWMMFLWLRPLVIV